MRIPKVVRRRVIFTASRGFMSGLQSTHVQLLIMTDGKNDFPVAEVVYSTLNKEWLIARAAKS